MSPMTSWSTWSMKVISRHCAACCKACCDGMDWSTHHGTILMTYQVPKRLFPLRPGQHLKGDEPRALSNSIFRWRIHRSRESPFHFDFCFAQSLAEQHNPSQPHTLTHSLLHIEKGPVLTQKVQKNFFHPARIRTSGLVYSPPSYGSIWVTVNGWEVETQPSLLMVLDPRDRLGFFLV